MDFLLDVKSNLRSFSLFVCHEKKKKSRITFYPLLLVLIFPFHFPRIKCGIDSFLSFISLGLFRCYFITRSLKKINSLLDLIESFPRQNQLDDDVVALLDRIRGKFKTVASALQTTERYVNAPKSKMFY